MCIKRDENNNVEWEMEWKTMDDNDLHISRFIWVVRLSTMLNSLKPFSHILLDIYYSFRLSQATHCPPLNCFWLEITKY